MSPDRSPAPECVPRKPPEKCISTSVNIIQYPRFLVIVSLCKSCYAKSGRYCPHPLEGRGHITPARGESNTLRVHRAPSGPGFCVGNYAKTPRVSGRSVL